MTKPGMDGAAGAAAWAIAALLACALAFAPAASAATVAPPAPDATASAKRVCRAYEFIGARGSGQSDTARYKGMGPEVFDLQVRLRARLGSSALTAYGVDYPAVDVLDPILNGARAVLHIGGPYTDSVREGTRDTVDEIKAAHKACPDMRFILAGYSQGANAVGDALQRMGDDLKQLVVAAAFFGDPYFNAASWSARTADPSRYGLFGPRDEWPDALRGYVFSYCHVGDPVCWMSTRHHIWGDGEVYTRNVGGLDKNQHITPAYIAQGDTERGAKAIAEALGAQQPAGTLPGPLDLAFAIDSTGSMTDEIATVQANVVELVNEIARIAPDFRVALVDYKDEPFEASDYQSRLDTDFTNDVGAFSTALSALEATGGGDTIESVYAGIMTALGLAWRPEAQKVVVQIGDAAAKDPEPLTGYTLDDVRRRAIAVGPVVVHTVQAGLDEEAQVSFTAIANATAGTYTSLPDVTDLAGLVPAIQGAVQRSASAPKPALAVPSSGVADSIAAFNATASDANGSPIVGYDWDFDGDGVYDLATPDGVATHTYAAAYNGPVTVRVRTASGNAALATGTVAIAPMADVPPVSPTGLAASAAPRSVTLTWTAPAGSQARWFTIRTRGGRLLDRIAAGAEGAPQSWQQTGLLNGHRYAYTVVAGNERGDGAAVGPVAAVPRGRGAVSRLRIAPRALRAAPAGGALVRYRSARASRTTIAVQRKLWVGRCGARGAARRQRAERRCRTRYVTVGRLVRRDHRGAVSFRFSGRTGGGALAPGAYRLRVVSHDSTGTGLPVYARFRVRG